MKKFKVRKTKQGSYLCECVICYPITVCIDFSFTYLDKCENLFYYTFDRAIRRVTFVDGKMNNENYCDFIEKHFQQEIEQTFHDMMNYLKKDSSYRLKLLPLLDDETRKLWNM